jgi:hypothetical protein
MSSLGQKITRRAQVLGQKIESKGQQLGQKAGQYLRMADAGLRKTENTLKNVIIPASGVVGMLSGNPQISALGALGGGAALGITRGLRNDIKPAQNIASRLEKLNLRKEADDLLEKARQSQGQSMFA